MDDRRGKPIEMPLRGRPRKRDAELFAHDYFEERDRTAFPPPRQDPRGAGDEMMHLLGLDTFNDGVVDGYVRSMEGRREGVRLADYLDAERYSPRFENGPPDLSSFTNEFKVHRPHPYDKYEELHMQQSPREGRGMHAQGYPFKEQRIAERLVPQRQYMDEWLTASLYPDRGYPSPEDMRAPWMNRKKRKNNPLLWQYIKNNQTFHPGIIHPSKYSSIDFIQGDSQKMYLGSVRRPVEKSSGNSVLPLFLSSEKESDEFLGVVQNFRSSVDELDFDNVTVQQLKNLMKEFGLNHTGKKNELIERLQSILKKIDKKEDKPEEIPEKKDVDDFGFYFF